jgi:uncharacterized membrane protein
MTENTDKLKLLIDKLEAVSKRQEAFSRELAGIREEINWLREAEKKPVNDNQEPTGEKPVVSTHTEINKEGIPLVGQKVVIQTIKEPLKHPASKVSEPQQIQADLEKFIGENLINKIGIIITVIGVAIGAKYAIDHDLISPLTRIILAYLVGFGLLLFALRLKKKYENFSAVLLSGSMAIMYFVTYAAYTFYQLFPQSIAFIFMVIVTSFTVTAAIKYNRQVIAHIGLVGAYAVPFLLSEGSGNVVILFSYTAIINIGILVISFKKYWKPLYYSSFLMTWLMYLVWLGSKYVSSLHFGVALTFLSLFFVIFYLMFLAYKLLQKEKFDAFDIMLLLTNSFIFYGIGYGILSKHDAGEHLLGLFTLCNAIVHSLVSITVYRQKLADRNLFYLILGLVLVFITIAIPVQLNGNWVTLLWAGEAALLFWIGRTRSVQFYENISYAIMFLAFFSIIHDWTTVYSGYTTEHPEARIIPLLNINFLTSILFITSFGFINLLNRNTKYPSPFTTRNELLSLVSFAITAYLLFVFYFSFKMEISTWFNQLYIDSYINDDRAGNPAKYWNRDLPNFKTIWIINYSFLFFSVLTYVNRKKLKSMNLGVITLAFSAVLMIVFLFMGLYILSELRETWLNQTLSEYYHRGFFNFGIRYVSFAFAALLLVSSYLHIKEDFLKEFVYYDLKIAFDLLLYTTLIWILSSELISWMDIMHSTQSYKLALSILWGVYSLVLIGLGIWKKKKHLRIGAIVLFAITLIKLFFYDLSHLDTISKTIVFVTLGILLLVISFLYNKYRNLISEDAEK